MSEISDPCVAECFKPSSQWKYINIDECISKCKSLNFAKP